MVYEVEDEIDWSDGPLGSPTPTAPETAPSPVCYEPEPVQTDATDRLFVTETFDQYEVPLGSPLPTSTSADP